jgi:hypothetical protein
MIILDSESNDFIRGVIHNSDQPGYVYDGFGYRMEYMI